MAHELEGGAATIQPTVGGRAVQVSVHVHDHPGEREHAIAAIEFAAEIVQDGKSITAGSSRRHFKNCAAGLRAAVAGASGIGRSKEIAAGIGEERRIRHGPILAIRQAAKRMDSRVASVAGEGRPCEAAGNGEQRCQNHRATNIHQPLLLC